MLKNLFTFGLELGQPEVYPIIGLKCLYITGTCPDGDKCEYSHKKDIIDAAKEKKKSGGKGKGKDKKGGSGKGKVKQICRDFNTPGKGCLRGSSCHFLHEQPAMAAAPIASAPASAVAGQ